MKTLTLLALMITSATSFAATCEQMRDQDLPSKRIKSVNVLNEQNWKKLDVIAAFSKERCKDGFSQELLEIDGQRYIEIVSNEDSCDGGNSYGALFTEDLKPVAHIYDGDFACESDGWSEEYKASNHVCDELAEAHAEEKMQAFGLDFKAEDSYLNIRKPYIYSKVSVSGLVKGEKRATVDVHVNLKNCKISSASISSLYL